ncbi:Protein of unknown function (DUF2510) [Mycobacterium sp. JS623]|uniref:DUF2510 domain-containing protein n=1 Tax=Mycobacterium sp. JS623 TaxID=212767 RepID=UPI0002A57BDA|nr:DUF2510 domain-containing protein [Mycobacterium sp. JS623]AGB21663.1 Protein of unknown function (DUF2510) [Mycobacterium sp. JS623]
MPACASGHKNPDGHHFCGQCGAALPTDDETKHNVAVDPALWLELPESQGFLRRTTFKFGNDETPPAPPPGWYPDPSGGPGLMYWDGRRWAERAASSQSPTTARSWKVLAIIGLAVFLLVGGWFVLAVSQSRHDSTSRVTPTRTTPTLTPDKKFVIDMDDNFQDELNPDPNTSLWDWRNYTEEIAHTGHDICAYLGSHTYEETAQKFKFDLGFRYPSYPSDSDARAFVNIAIDDLCPQYANMKPR